ncbi:hypothetical protein Tco_1321420 [Tanacetum coccineum]
MVPRAVLMKSDLVSINTARQVNTAYSKTTVNAARPMSYLSKTTHSTVKRPINNNTTFKHSNINQRVNTVRDKNVNTARPKAVVNDVQWNNDYVVKRPSLLWFWKPKTKVLDHVSKHNSASITLNKFDYIDAQGRSKHNLLLLVNINAVEALVDGKKVIITESTVRRDLQLEDTESVDCLPNSTIFEQLTLMGKPKRKDTQIPQSSGPTEHVADEAVYKELDDSLVRAATTASSLDAEQNMGNINKTQSKATPNEAGSQGTTSGGGPRGNTLQSGEDSLKLNELMELCITVQQKCLDLDTTKTIQANKIASLKRRVKKIERRNKSRTHGLKRMYRVGSSRRVESYEDEDVVKTAEETRSVVEEVTAVIEKAKLVSAAEEIVNVAATIVTTASTILVSAATTTTTTTATITDVEITLAQALA